MYQLLFRYQIRSLFRFFEKNRGAKVLTVLGFLAAFGFLIAVVYGSFYYGFSYIAKDFYFKEALTIYIVELFFLVSFALVYISALLSMLFSLFRASDDTIIIASPRFQLRLGLVFARMFLSSLWPLLAIILPALIALAQVSGLSLLGLCLGVLSSIVMIAAANVFAIVTVLLISDILDAFGKFSLRHSIVGTIVFGMLLLILVWENFRSLDLVTFFQARLLSAELPDLTPILHQFRLFPSHFSALTIFYSELRDYKHAIFALGYTALLLGLFLVSFALLKSEYLGLWQKAQEGMMRKRGDTGGTSLHALDSLMRTARTPLQAMLRKECITFFRNVRGMLWVLFIVFIWIIQSASSRVLAHGLSGERIPDTLIPVSVSSLQFAVILYFVAMLVLRFAFPSFSAEQKNTWAVRTAPLNQGNVFAAKLLFFTVLFSLIAVLFILWNAWTKGLLLPLGLPIFFAVLLGTFFLTSFGLSLGALYPNFETDDPERLSTTLPGVGFILGALAYGVFGAFALQSYFYNNNMLYFSLFIFFSLMLSLFLIMRANLALRLVARSS